jgi:hypothetical protein
MAVSQPTFTTEACGPAVCANYDLELLGDFCHRCGEQKHHAEELTLKHFFLHATHDLTHIDTKVFATLRYLFTRPGFLTQEFICRTENALYASFQPVSGGLRHFLSGRFV